MESDALDKLILDWCKKNNWEKPQKIDELWYAIPPGSHIPVPVLISSNLNKSIRELCLVSGVSSSIVRDSICHMVECLSRPQVINSIQKAFSEVTTTLQTVGKQMQKPMAPATISNSAVPTKDWIQKRDRRNQKLMRDFLKTSISRK